LRCLRNHGGYGKVRGAGRWFMRTLSTEILVPSRRFDYCCDGSYLGEVSLLTADPAY
jgi:hypothetical protein